MNAPLKDLVPTMREFKISNEYLGDQAALRAAWDRDGYLFFRDVLDHAPLERMRALLADYLDRHGFADRSDPQLRWNGKAREGFTFFPIREMNNRRAAATIMEDPAIRAFFQRLFGVPLYWLRTTEYRTTPPAIDRTKTRFDFIHHDSIYSDRLDFIIGWIPLGDIDADVGGLCVAEGLHKQPTLHRMDGRNAIPIDPSQVPQDAWARTNYRLGDLLLMHKHTPHSGIANHSDRFRLSIDTRLLPEGGDFPYVPRLPYIGELIEITSEQLVVRDTQGDHRLRLDDTSYVRGLMGTRLTEAEVSEQYPLGSEVIVAHGDGLVQTMRPAN